MSDETRNYEAVIVLNIQGEDGVDKLINSIGKEIESEGAKLEKVDKLGKQTFAYNARKQASGYYANFLFSAAPADVKKIREKLTLNSDIYLQHYQRA